MANKHMKRCSMSYVIRKIQIKTILRYHCTPIKMAQIWNTDNTTHADEDVDQQGPMHW